MAINRFQQSASANVTALYNWLNANKAGTFLENVTISKNIDTHQSNDTITLTKGNVTIKIIANYHYSGSDVLTYTSGNFSFSVKCPSYSDNSTYISGALLCTNGLFIQFNGKASSTFTGNNYGACITVDNNGNLALISTSTTIPDTTTQITLWETAAGDSTVKQSYNLRPAYGANLTSLAPLVAQGTQSNLYLPYAYAAICTQLNGEGLLGVSINGDNYITNGVWYIKDGD